MNTPLRASIAALAAVVVLGAAIYALGTRSTIGGQTTQPTSPPPTATIAAAASVAPPSPTAASSDAPNAQISVRHDGGLVFGYGSLWIGDQGGVQRINPATNTATTTIPVADQIQRLWDDGSTIVGSGQSSNFKIDPSTNIESSAGPVGMQALGATWFIDDGGTLHRFDGTTGQQTGTVSVEGTINWQPQLAAGAGALWIAEGDTKSLVRIDPSGPRVVTRITGFSTDDSLFVAGFAFNSVWVQSNAASGSGLLYRIDPNTNKIVATISLGDPAHGSGYGGTVLAFSSDSVWTADSSGTVTRVDPAKNKVVAVVHVALANVEWIAYGANSIWIRNQDVGAVLRYDAARWAAP